MSACTLIFPASIVFLCFHRFSNIFLPNLIPAHLFLILNNSLNYLLTLFVRNLKQEDKNVKKIILILLVCLSTLAVLGQKRIAPKSPEEKLNEEYCSGLFKMEDGIIFDLLSDNTTVNSYFNILDWLEGRVAGLQVFTLRNGVRIPVIRGQQATVYVDEVPVSPDFLNSLPVTDIAMIKVIKTPFLGGFNGSGGAIAIYTTDTGDDEPGEEK